MLKLQNLLEHIDFASKHTTTIKNVMLYIQLVQFKK